MIYCYCTDNIAQDNVSVTIKSTSTTAVSFSTL